MASVNKRGLLVREVFLSVTKYALQVCVSPGIVHFGRFLAVLIDSFSPAFTKCAFPLETTVVTMNCVRVSICSIAVVLFVCFGGVVSALLGRRQ